MKFRYIIAATLLASVSGIATAQDSDVVMRRPLPMSTRAPGTPTPPQSTESVFGWSLHCNAPDYADCQRITVDSNGQFTYEQVDRSTCLIAQSEDKNAIAIAAGNGPPGQYDFAAMCEGGPPQEPYEPTDGLVGYGYETNCVDQTMTCYKLTARVSGPYQWSTNWEDAEFHNCQNSQSGEAQELVRQSGLRPGYVGLYPSSAAAYCANPPSNMMYGYNAQCIDGTISNTYDCLGMDEQGMNWSPFPEEKCASFSPTPAQTAQLTEFGVYTTKAAAAESISGWCNPAPEPGPEDGLETDPEHVVEGEEPNQTVFDPKWEAGPWEGEGECGVETTLTRNVVCKAQPQCVPSNGGDLCTSPSDYPARVAVPSSMCSGQTMPSTTYTGTKAMCGYELSYVNGAWQNWEMGADIGCSSNSYRDRIPVCKNAQGQEVGIDYCRLSLDKGGLEQDISEREWGNYESCVYVAEPIRGQTTCNGPQASYTVTGYNCVRQDGATVSKDKCSGNDSIQFPYTVTDGNCVKTYNLTARGGYMTWCSTEDGQGYETLLLGSLPSYSDAQRRADQMCAAMNATCCQIEYNTGGATGSGGGMYKIMGTTGPVHLENYNNSWGYEQTGEETHANTPSWTPEQ